MMPARIGDKRIILVAVLWGGIALMAFLAALWGARTLIDLALVIQ